MEYFQALIEWIKENKPDKTALAKKKVLLCKELKRKTIPTDIEVFLHAKEEDVESLKPFLNTKPVRTGSGVAVVATMTKPFPCPHGSCTYCPGGPNSFFGDTPKSYTGKEPSTMRGIRHEYDPYRIIFNRLEQYIVMGQNPDKVEQIIMGGTFCALPEEYQEEFVRLSFKAYNDFSDKFYQEGTLKLGEFKEFFELPGKVGDERRAERIKEKVLALREQNKSDLQHEQKRNESALIRCIGLTVETKPDWGFAEHGRKMLALGATRIELGLQSLDDDVLRKVHRGHSMADTKRSIQELRDLGFKLNVHMMPGLPSPSGQRVSREHDIEQMRLLFADSAFRPDMLKIYPCMVMPGTALEKEFEKGVYKPLSTQEAADIIVESLRIVPEYCRIMRVQRDIPTFATTSGVDRTNLRQYVDVLARERNVQSRDIRSREIGTGTFPDQVELIVYEYEASSGTELFISAEGDDRILGFVRLRFPSALLHPSITERCALIRELHVYGSAIKVGGQDGVKAQHKGLGKRLMAKAEELALRRGRDKVLVISGLGVRGYYYRLGYVLDGPYVSKDLKRNL